jgi:hypothetical protein
MARSVDDVMLERLANVPRSGPDAVAPGGSGPAQAPNGGSLTANLSAALGDSSQLAAGVPAVVAATAATPQGKVFVQTGIGFVTGNPVKAAEGFGAVIVSGLTGQLDGPPPPPDVREPSVELAGYRTPPIIRQPVAGVAGELGKSAQPAVPPALVGDRFLLALRRLLFGGA